MSRETSEESAADLISAELQMMGYNMFPNRDGRYLILSQANNENNGLVCSLVESLFQAD